jgi:imidazolonepropionase-like amidohydrolase
LRPWVSGSALSPTGGHIDPSTGYDEELTKREWTEGIVDSPEEVIKKVRERHRAGADLIKIAPSGGVISVGDDPRHQHQAFSLASALLPTWDHGYSKE